MDGNQPTGMETGRPSISADGPSVPEDHPLPEQQGSLADDVTALIGDGRTYLSAELQFQKTRARHSGKEIGRIATFGGGAALFALLALIGLTVGSIIALSPVLTAWGATGVVVGILIIMCALLGLLAKRHLRRLLAGFDGGNL